MAELLIELLSEEIPARMQVRASDDLKKMVTDRLTGAGLTLDDVVAHSTPRRLAVCVHGLPERQPDIEEERKGPRIDAPEQALAGFMKANGLDSLDGCEQRKSPKGTFYYLAVRKDGVATVDLIPGLLQDVVDKFPWPKSMRWARGARSWVRPLRSALCLFDGEQLAFELTFDGETVPVGGTTAAHRFMAPGELTISGFEEYQAQLEGHYVLLDRDRRKARIVSGASALAERAGLRIKPDAALVEEVVGLAEWPVPLLGAIDDEFMDLPPEVLTTSMRAHQKYLALETPDGALANRFCVVANIETDDGGAAIVAGNERVLRARLSDAKFFWDQDRKTPLGDMGAGLDKVVFHAKLGSMGEKVARVADLAERLAGRIDGCDPASARRAAVLGKADLESGMVGEFPELQGLMGRYYAREQGEPQAVADAIGDHYSPLGPNDACPSAPASVAVALADKIDTLVGFWAIGEKPTGSKDPFALRRAALGAIRLALENQLRVGLIPLFDSAYRSYLHDFTRKFWLCERQDDPALGIGRDIEQDFLEKHDPDLEPMWLSPADFSERVAISRFASEETATRLPTPNGLSTDLLGFLADRLKAALRDKGVRHDLIGAVFAVEKAGGGPEDDLVRLTAKVDALAGFLETPDGESLLAAYRRAANILRIEEKKDGRAYDQEADEGALEAAEEADLHRRLINARDRARPALEREDFVGAMAALAALRAPVDAFFDRVTVNADDARLRENRLRLLSGIRRTLEQVADFSMIEG